MNSKIKDYLKRRIVVSAILAVLFLSCILSGSQQIFSIDSLEEAREIMHQSTIEQFFDVFSQEIKNEIFKSIPRYDLFYKVSRVSTKFYDEMWQKKKEFLANQYLEYGIFNKNSKCDIEHIDQHFDFF